MKKLRGMPVGVMVFLVVLAASSYAKEPVYLGVSIPITGNYSEYGSNLKNGIELALDFLNKEGGIDGRPIELIIMDSRGVPKISKRIARKFTDDKRIIAEIGDFSSSCSMAAAPVYEKGGMVQLSPSSSHPSFAPGSPFSFSIARPQTDEGTVMARKAINVLKKKKLAVLYINNDWGVVSQELFIKEAERLGAKIVATESYFEGTTEFTPVLEKLYALEPELLYLCAMYNDGAMICKQQKKLGWNDVTIMGPGSLYSQKLIALAGNAAENLYTATIFFPTDHTPVVQEFVKAYRKRYNQMPNTFDALAYDAMILLVKAIRKAGTDRKAIRDELARVETFSGVTGKMTFTQHGTVITDRVMLKVKNGEFVIIDSY